MTLDDIARELGELVEDQDSDSGDRTFDVDLPRRDMREYAGGWSVK